MLEITGLSRSFGAFALDRITLRVEAGQYAVILGPSGCGKSLLLSTLAGLHRPESGRVLVSGRDVTALSPEQRGVGLVFQESSLFPHLKVEENVGFGLRVRGVPKAERQARVDDLVAALGLGGIRSQEVGTLSGGEAQRVALARALVVRPAVLLLDEPLSQLDHNTRLELQAELRRIHNERQLTTLHVTHNREEARALGDFCAVMLGGRIVQAGKTAEVFDKPQCTFVARFLGTSLPAGTTEPPGCSGICLAGTGRCDRSTG